MAKRRGKEGTWYHNAISTNHTTTICFRPKGGKQSLAVMRKIQHISYNIHSDTSACTAAQCIAVCSIGIPASYCSKKNSQSSRSTFSVDSIDFGMRTDS